MAVKASDFIKKKSKSEDKPSGKKGGKSSLLDWIGDRRNKKGAVNKGSEDDHDE